MSANKGTKRYGFDHTTADGQKRLMAVSMGLDSETYITRYTERKTGDYGCDPIGDGTFRMVPSGDIVDLAERNGIITLSCHSQTADSCQSHRTGRLMTVAIPKELKRNCLRESHWSKTPSVRANMSVSP